MVELPAVALLFEDVALGEQLRSALLERGARIVHEGALGSLGPEQLLAIDADVLVVNLEADDDEALDRLYALIEGDRPRVVFNDAQASRKLEGWDRARWARHLAMKALEMGEVDPPRPEDAREIDTPTAVLAEAAPSPAVVAAVEEDPAHRQTVAASETLAAELEALLAAEEPGNDADFFGHGRNDAASEAAPIAEMQFDAPVDFADADELAPAENDADEANDFGHGLNYAADESALIAEIDFNTPVDAFDEHEVATAVSKEPDAPMADAESISPDRAPLPLPPSLSLVGDAQASFAATTSPASSGAVTPPPLPGFLRASDSWSLLDDAGPIMSASALKPAASAFGIEVQDAADYLAPEADTDHADSPIIPGFSLELMSIEEAIAPQHYQPTHEMMLDELSTGLKRLVLLGATTEGTSAVCQFLSCLPADLPITVLHTQHQAGKPSEALVEYLAESCHLSVRLAAFGMRARKGEVLVVPTDHQVRLRRDGVIELQPIGEHLRHAPSIDISFTMAAGEFGADALAIVFAGLSTDAVGGCQAIHDRGGRVWVEAPSAEHGADMVSGVLAERLSHYSGTPQQLATRLVEEILMESRS